MPRFLNTLNQKMEVLPYDDLYHLKLIVSLSDQYNIMHQFQIEKAPHIRITSFDTSYSKLKKGDEFMWLDRNAITCTLDELLDGAKRVLGNLYFSYNAFTNENCQGFVMAMLQGQNALTPRLEHFILQEFDLTTVNSAYLKGVKTITDLAKIYHKLFTGGEIEE